MMCEPESCLCSPQAECFETNYEINPDFHIGEHDVDYTINLEVMNYALLKTKATLKVKVKICIVDLITTVTDV